MRANVRVWAVALGGGLLLAGCDSGPPPGGFPNAETGAAADTATEVQAFGFVERLGTDTTALESHRVFSDRIEGLFLTRRNGTRVTRYLARLGPSGDLQSLDVELFQPPFDPDAEPFQIYTVQVRADSIIVNNSGGRTPGRSALVRDGPVFATAGKYPPSAALWEHHVRLALLRGSLAVAMVPGGRAMIQEQRVERGPEGIVQINPMRMDARVDGRGRIAGTSGARTTTKVAGERTGPLDIWALARGYAAREASGDVLRFSLRDTARVALGGGLLAIDYSRPSRRGREIFGGLVPYGEVWRTGADAATHLHTDVDVVLGDQPLEAGSYTLWSTYTPESGRLLVNAETGQWGTAHDPGQDLFSVAMEPQALTDPVEQFTIELHGRDDGASLELVWDRTRWRVPIRVR